MAFGNLIVVIIAEAKAFDSQAAEFFLFAGLMAVDMGIFIVLAMKYKYVELNNNEDEPLPRIDLPQKDTNGFKTIDINGKKESGGVANTAFTEDWWERDLVVDLGSFCWLYINIIVKSVISEKYSIIFVHKIVFFVGNL